MRDAQLTERLFVHYVGGQWRAPLGTRPLSVPGGRIAVGDKGDIDRACRLMATVPAMPVALLSAGDVPADLLLDHLDRLSAGPGVIWKPAPTVAAQAHSLIQAHGARFGRAVAMIQGDHETGRALAARLPVVWLSARPVPQSAWRVLSGDAAKG